MKIQNQLELAKTAVLDLALLKEKEINELLTSLAHKVTEETSKIIEANRLDLDKMDENDPKYDRLKLTPERIEGIAADILNVASLPTPCGEILEEKQLENGLELKKVRVPLGVIGVIYEARPNVTLDVFSLCLKSQNVAILKGGSDAHNSNSCLTAIIKNVLISHKINPEIVQLLPPDRSVALELMQADGFVDVLIPRGSKGLIDFVRHNSSVPVIETGAGIVHTYFDQTADVEMGRAIITNAKTRRVSVCNALDTLLIHTERVSELPEICKYLAEKDTEILADQAAFKALQEVYPEKLLNHADESAFGTEFLANRLAIKTVINFQKALEHIRENSSKHSEAIITNCEKTAEIFCQLVDAAAVYVNTSTAFTDGAQFDLGAEIGISTQKLHARGPMGLAEICSYKWVIKGTGQIRA